jgi:uncharacterized protein DUF3108
MHQLWRGAGRAHRAALLSAALMALTAASAQSPVKAEPGETSSGSLPSRVVAVYRVEFGLLGDIGFFKFTSDLEGDNYTLSAHARIDTAVFDYSGKMSSTGSIRAEDAKPTRHKFGWRQKAFLGKKKKKSLSIDFDRTGATDVKFVPHEDRSNKKGIVHVTDEDLRNVLDPLSGVLALSVGDMERPCDRRLPIFDGKQRFDLVFSQARRKRGGNAVCNVRLIAISGHKKGEGADSIINGNIEVELRPVPKANILVPYRVTVPTIVGSAVLASKKVDITLPDRKRIAWRH